jgi:hypothetical protein
MTHRLLAPPLVQLGALQKELAAVEAQLTRVDKLLRIADPDGWWVCPE